MRLNTHAHTVGHIPIVIFLRKEHSDETWSR